MKASIEEQRAQLMESGYIMCRGMIPPDELPSERQIRAWSAVNFVVGRVEVQWQDGNLSSHTGKPVRLRFTLRNAELYSYWFD